MNISLAIIVNKDLLMDKKVNWNLSDTEDFCCETWTPWTVVYVSDILIFEILIFACTPKLEVVISQNHVS